MPQRIQRKRTKGWRMPAGAVYVGRPTKWGNPWRPGEWHGFGRLTPAKAVEMYRNLRDARWWNMVPEDRMALESLRGKDLVCWCPLDQPCHADVLLEIANR